MIQPCIEWSEFRLVIWTQVHRYLNLSSYIIMKHWFFWLFMFKLRFQTFHTLAKIFWYTLMVCLKIIETPVKIKTRTWRAWRVLGKGALHWVFIDKEGFSKWWWPIIYQYIVDGAHSKSEGLLYCAKDQKSFWKPF